VVEPHPAHAPQHRDDEHYEQHYRPGGGGEDLGRDEVGRGSGWRGKHEEDRHRHLPRCEVVDLIAHCQNATRKTVFIKGELQVRRRSLRRPMVSKYGPTKRVLTKLTADRGSM
jgi:hypothetical protein